MILKRKQMFIGVFVSILIFSVFSGSMVWASALDQLRNGAENFSGGKEETDYFITEQDASTLLNSKIEEYTAGRENPQPINTDQVQTIVDNANDEEKVDLTNFFTIASDNDIQRALQKMVDDSKTIYAYELSGGYTMNLDLVANALMEVERKDPIDAICVLGYGFSDDGFTGNLVLDYSVPRNQLCLMKQETRTLVNEALRDLNYVNGQSDIRITYEVNEYVCDRVEYPDKDWVTFPDSGYSPESHTAWSALKYGSAVCDGYARTCKLILNELGVKCDIVYGNAGSDPDAGNHAWNLVNIENAWYHMDVCWNDGSNTRQDYFLMPDSVFSKDHLWDVLLYPTTAATPYDFQGKV